MSHIADQTVTFPLGEAIAGMICICPYCAILVLYLDTYLWSTGFFFPTAVGNQIGEKLLFLPPGYSVSEGRLAYNEERDELAELQA